MKVVKKCWDKDKKTCIEVPKDYEKQDPDEHVFQIVVPEEGEEQDINILLFNKESELEETTETNLQKIDILFQICGALQTKLQEIEDRSLNNEQRIVALEEELVIIKSEKNE